MFPKSKILTSLLGIICVCVIFNQKSLAQGCSDAGFCTMNGLRANHQKADSNTYRSWLKFGTSFGLADYSISALGNYLEYSYKSNNKLSASIRIISLGHIGNGIKVWDLGDILLSSSYQINHDFSVSLGIKTPLTKGNKIYKNMPLPMDYQASLGTYDIILGLAYQYKKFSINAGLQYPLVQNDNTFLQSEVASISHIPPTNRFMRAPDVLLRLSYPFNLSSKFSLTPSILPIYHLYNDQYLDRNNLKHKIQGSQGLTLNLNLYLNYNINPKHKIQLSIGAPVIVRKVRPDGLTRHFIANLEYSFALH